MGYQEISPDQIIMIKGMVMQVSGLAGQEGEEMKALPSYVQKMPIQLLAVEILDQGHGVGHGLGQDEGGLKPADGVALLTDGDGLWTGYPQVLKGPVIPEFARGFGVAGEVFPGGGPVVVELEEHVSRRPIAIAQVETLDNHLIAEGPWSPIQKSDHGIPGVEPMATHPGAEGGMDFDHD